MAIEVIMPKVDMDQETGTVVEWCKATGEQVNEGEILLVIETDKVAVDVESPGSGVLDGISAQPRDVVPIGKVIAYLLAEGEAIPEQIPDPEAEPQKKPSPVAAPIPQAVTPVARNMAAAHGIDINSISPEVKDQRITKADVAARLSSDYISRIDGKVYASPAARRVARENQEM